MRGFRIDRSIIFLIIILAILVIAAVSLVLGMKTNPVKESLSGDKILKVLLVLESEGKPLATNIIAYYPGNKRSAMFDIPGETGLILRSLERVDRIDAVYTEKGIHAYRTEIEGLTGISIPFSIEVSLDNFSRLADLLSGLSVFIPSPVDIQDEQGRVLLPSGAVTLDGDKLRTYVTYIDPLDQEGEASSRRQKALLAFFRALNDNFQYAFSDSLFPTIEKSIRANISSVGIRMVLEELSQTDAERLVPQRVTGSLREVDGKLLLFPFYDGQLLKDIIRQTLAGLTSENAAAQERIYALEILNGTGSHGLARNTSELYQSFGYDVLRIGNAETTETDQTVIIDRIGNQAVAQTVAQVIQCSNIVSTSVTDTGDDLYGTEAVVDFTIILGKDFNGRYVR
ncbi:MAG TPA: LCP family protein [Treponemataceae bacterium]|nr:LCP family protein [Treponemataceae bacterium]